MDFNDFMARQREFSSRAFGPGKRTVGITEHIKKEIVEVRAKPDDTEEWVDIILLGADGYWRAGGANLEADLEAKQARNIAREWPPPPPEDQASEHVRDGEPQTEADLRVALRDRLEKLESARDTADRHIVENAALRVRNDALEKENERLTRELTAARSGQDGVGFSINIDHVLMRNVTGVLKPCGCACPPENAFASKLMFGLVCECQCHGVHPPVCGVVSPETARHVRGGVACVLPAGHPGPSHQGGHGEMWRDDTTRCPKCGWPFAASREEGCVPGDCSFRPRGGI